MKLSMNLKTVERSYTEPLSFYLKRFFFMIKIIKKWAVKYRLHLLLWMMFILYETVVIGLITGVFGNIYAYTSHYILIFLLFYIHADFFLPHALRNNLTAIWKLPAILILEIVAFIFLSYFTDELLIRYHFLFVKHYKLTYQNSLQSLYRGLYFIGFSTGYYFIITYNIERRKTAELEKQRLNDIIYRQNAEQELIRAQNAFLKAQINPHFLFNNLHFIYHHIANSSPVAAEAIITLVEMMRFAIDADKMGDYILLADEIEQVDHLIYLNQIRKNHELDIRFDYDREVLNIYLIPLVLLTLVENIFKHGNLSESGHEASIKIFTANGDLCLTTDNLSSAQVSQDSRHTGLFNTEQRLRFAYGDDFTFRYTLEETNHFKVFLSIPLQQLKSPAGLL